MSMRIPKLKGFRNPNKESFAIINLSGLQSFKAGSVITPEELRKRGLVKHQGRVKALAQGDLDKALTVRVHAVRAAAQPKIDAAGGTV
jgi:large subunit ribosomal protein L15